MRWTPVDIDGYVLSGAVTEGSCGRELLRAAVGHGWVRGGDRERNQRAIANRQRGGSFQAGSAGGNGSAAGFLAESRSGTAHGGDLGRGRFPGHTGQVAAGAAIAEGADGGELQQRVRLNAGVAGQNGDAHQLDGCDRQASSTGYGAENGTDGGAAGGHTGWQTLIVDAGNAGLGGAPQHDGGHVLRAAVTESSSGGELLGGAHWHVGIGRRDGDGGHGSAGDSERSGSAYRARRGGDGRGAGADRGSHAGGVDGRDRGGRRRPGHRGQQLRAAIIETANGAELLIRTDRDGNRGWSDGDGNKIGGDHGELGGIGERANLGGDGSSPRAHSCG